MTHEQYILPPRTRDPYDSVLIGDQIRRKKKGLGRRHACIRRQRDRCTEYSRCCAAAASLSPFHVSIRIPHVETIRSSPARAGLSFFFSPSTRPRHIKWGSWLSYSVVHHQGIFFPIKSILVLSLVLLFFLLEYICTFILPICWNNSSRKSN